MNGKGFEVLWICITIYFICTVVTMSMIENRTTTKIDTLQQQVLSVIKEVKK